MRVLLDTHALLWLLEDDARLSQGAKDAIFMAEYAAVSAAGLWEIAIKQSIGKLDYNESVEHIAQLCNELGIAVLGIQYKHMDAIKQLPDMHRDPFDRLIIAQAKCEGLTIVTKDANIAKYEEVQTVWD